MKAIKNIINIILPDKIIKDGPVILDYVEMDLMQEKLKHCNKQDKAKF